MKTIIKITQAKQEDYSAFVRFTIIEMNAYFHAGKSFISDYPAGTNLSITGRILDDLLRDLRSNCITEE